MNRTSLCIKMLLLLKARGKMNTQQLAAELETNPRNIREFKKELITAGYNIKEYKGRYGGYRLDETNLFPVLALTSSQKQALIEAREFMHAQGYENEADLNAAIDKVLNSSSSSLPTQRIYMDAPILSMTTKEKDMMETMQKALEQKHCVLLTYQSRNQDHADTFLMDPYEIIHYHDAYYVLGYSHKRNDYRIYRFSQERMFSCMFQERKFLRDSHFHIEQYIGKNSLIKGEFVRVSVHVDPEIQPQFRELYWGMDMQEKEDVFQFLVEDFFTFYRQLFSFQDQVEILAPENIREEYQAQLKLILRKYIG